METDPAQATHGRQERQRLSVVTVQGLAQEHAPQPVMGLALAEVQHKVPDNHLEENPARKPHFG